jgi:Protein of unknown function (DUF3592)
VAGGLVLIAIGLATVYGGVAELVGWWRSRHRRRRVTAVIIGLHEPVAVNPGSRGRFPVFRFTTDGGQVIDAVSSAWTFPEPKVGRHIPVTYDPADPQRSAERVGVRALKLVLSPLLIAGGLALAVFGLTFL